MLTVVEMMLFEATGDVWSTTAVHAYMHACGREMKKAPALPCTYLHACMHDAHVRMHASVLNIRLRIDYEKTSTLMSVCQATPPSSTNLLEVSLPS